MANLKDKYNVKDRSLINQDSVYSRFMAIKPNSIDNTSENLKINNLRIADKYFDNSFIFSDGVANFHSGVISSPLPGDSYKFKICKNKNIYYGKNFENVRTLDGVKSFINAEKPNSLKWMTMVSFNTILFYSTETQKAFTYNLELEEIPANFIEVPITNHTAVLLNHWDECRSFGRGLLFVKNNGYYSFTYGYGLIDGGGLYIEPIPTDSKRFKLLYAPNVEMSLEYNMTSQDMKLWSESTKNYDSFTNINTVSDFGLQADFYPYVVTEVNYSNNFELIIVGKRASKPSQYETYFCRQGSAPVKLGNQLYDSSDFMFWYLIADLNFIFFNNATKELYVPSGTATNDINSIVTLKMDQNFNVLGTSNFLMAMGQLVIDGEQDACGCLINKELGLQKYIAFKGFK